MKIKYVRCSSITQNYDRQLEDADQYNLIYQEKISGKSKDDRVELQNMLKAIRAGDQCFTEDISRLARNTLDLLTIIKEIRDKGASITFIKEGWTFSNEETFASKTQEMMLTIMGAIAQAERITIKERQMAGIRIAQRKHKYEKAHPTKLNSVLIQQVKDDRAAGMTETELMNKYHISKPTLYRYLKK
jgi:DNA invertase Pin-like site-specific DNA recombinase